MTIPVVQSITLRRFRSLRDAEVKLDNPTFLVGPNGAGKSNFVDAFAFLAEAMISPLPAVFDRRGGVATVTHRTSNRGRRPGLGMRVDLKDLDETTEACQLRVRAACGEGPRLQGRPGAMRGGEEGWLEGLVRSVRRPEVQEQSAVPRSRADGECSDPAPGRRTPQIQGRLSVSGGDGRLSDRSGGVARDAGLRTTERASVLTGETPPACCARYGAGARKTGRESARSSRPSCRIPSEANPKRQGNKLALEFIQDWGTVGAGQARSVRGVGRHVAGIGSAGGGVPAVCPVRARDRGARGHHAPRRAGSRAGPAAARGTLHAGRRDHPQPRTFPRYGERVVW